MDKTETTSTRSNLDPTFNVREMFESTTSRQDSLREGEIHRIDHDIDTEIGRVDEKFKDNDVKYQIQFSAAKEALGIALIAQEKAVASALDSTKEAINKAEIATDKRFELLSEKIDGVNEILSKNTGAQGIYVTHGELSTEMEKLRLSFENMIRPVVTYMNSSQGKSTGLNASWIYLLGGVSLISTIIAIFVALSK